MTTRDWKYCRPCIYSLRIGHQRICDHLCQTGHCRGCPAGVGCKRFTPFDRGRAFDLWFIGMTDKDTAAQLRCTLPVVTRWRIELGLARNTRDTWYYPSDVLERVGVQLNG